MVLISYTLIFSNLMWNVGDMKKWLTIWLACFSLSLSASIGALYRPDEPCTPWISGEFLYWKAFQGGMEFADSYDPVLGDLANADAHEIEASYEPGFRLEAGYSSACFLDVAVSYTWLRSRARKSLEGIFFPTFNYFGSAQGGVADQVTSASAKWNLLFQTIDGTVGHKYGLGSVLLHPHVGVVGAWIDQKINVAYDGAPDEVFTGPFLVSMKNYFWGVGLKGGIESSYPLCGGLSLFGGLDALLLYGEFDVKQVQNQVGVTQIDLSESFSRICPALQTFIGLAWEQPFFPGCSLPFVISLAAEWQYWWNQNQTERFTSGTFAIHVVPEHDLGLFGLTLKGTIFF
jgi:hypothetical protein